MGPLTGVGDGDGEDHFDVVRDALRDLDGVLDFEGVRDGVTLLHKP